jgi:hypothetical protein
VDSNDWVPLAEVDSIIIDNHLAETRPAQQDLALKTIQSLAEDGLMEIGDIPEEGDRVIPWNVSLVRHWRAYLIALLGTATTPRFGASRFGSALPRPASVSLGSSKAPSRRR